uniref:Uncharacterized protein n=1 Tax=Oryza sativa subsp. japonica TaxID=39947 RepID=Q6H830_ORYSJ|nr:hypothetical protein [Oryza sativa Japonica Group]
MAAAIERAAAAVDNGDEECNGGAQQWRRQCRTLLGQCSAMAVAEELEAEMLLASASNSKSRTAPCAPLLCTLLSPLPQPPPPPPPHGSFAMANNAPHTPSPAIEATTSVITKAVRDAFQPSSRVNVDLAIAASVVDTASTTVACATRKALASFIEKLALHHCPRRHDTAADLSPTTAGAHGHPCHRWPLRHLRRLCIRSACSGRLCLLHHAQRYIGNTPSTGSSSSGSRCTTTTSSRLRWFHPSDDRCCSFCPYRLELLQRRPRRRRHRQSPRSGSLGAEHQVSRARHPRSQLRQWCGLILVTLEKYVLADHVLTNLYRPDHQDWMRMDCVQGRP